MIEFINSLGGWASVGILIAGIGFAYAQFRSGSSKAKDEIIATYKEQAIAEREKATRLAEEKATLIKNHQDQLNELNKQIGVLQGRADANEKKMNEYLLILKGQSPEQLAFIEKTTATLDNIARFMKHINDGIAKGNNFDAQVESDTAEGVGKTLRKQV